MTSQFQKHLYRHRTVGLDERQAEDSGKVRSGHRRAIAVGFGLAMTLPMATTIIAPAASAAPARAATSPTATAKKLCLGIPLSSVKPLFKVALHGPIVATGGTTCEFTPTKGGSQAATLFVIISPGDYGSQYEEYITNQTHYSVSGIGDKAAFSWAVGPPVFGAVKANTSCVVTTQQSVGETTLIYKTSGGNPVVTKANAATYAKKMGAVCKAVFSGK